MKSKIVTIAALSLFSGLGSLSAQSIWAPSTTIGTSSTQGVGIGTNAPIGSMDIRSNCVTGSLATLLVTGNGYLTCAGGQGFGDAFRVRTETAAGVFRSDFIVKAATGNVGVGVFNPTFRLEVNTSNLNDGIRVLQTGASSAALRLDNSYTNGHNWGVLSTSDGNSQLGAKLIFYDYSGSGTKERMTIDGSGNVGIATYTPATRLHIKTTTANDGIRVEQATSGNSIVGLYNTSASAHNWTLNSTGSGSTQGSGNFMIRDETAGTVNFIMKGSNGYTGIGLTSAYDPTFTPRTRLHINDGSLKFTGTDPVHGAPNIFWGGNLSTAANGEWGLEYNATMGGMNFWRPSGATGGFANNILFLGNNNKVGIGTANTTKALLTVNGKTLIGDPAVINTATTFNYMLYVQGGILTEKIKVAVASDAINWSDYVFAPEYNLRPLAEVDSFVTKYHHLPDVPSADQVYAEGIDVAQMDATLLMKIEELTLYIIELEKRMAVLEEEGKK